MKRIGFVLLLLEVVVAHRCTGAGNAASDSGKGVWEVVRASRHDGYYHALCFSDERNGWVVGDSGRILKTNDGGETWSFIQVDPPITLQCICSVGSNLAWIGGSKNSIGRTSDGGHTWAWRHSSESDRSMIMSISFVTENEGWAVDNSGGILHTINGGAEWDPEESGTGRAISSVHFTDSREGWASAMNKDVLHTIDSGRTWKRTTLDKLPYGYLTTAIFSSVFSYHSSVWIGTNVTASNFQPQTASIVYSPDGGTNWSCQSTPEKHMIGAIRFVDQNLGWAAGFQGILHTIDGGEHWAYQHQSNDHPYVDISFVDSSHGWALTFGGTVYRYHLL